MSFTHFGKLFSSGHFEKVRRTLTHLIPKLKDEYPLFKKTSLFPQFRFLNYEKDLKPRTAGFLKNPSMFSQTVLAKNKEVYAIICITLIGVTLEALWTLRLALTRDDVRWIPEKFGGKMALETVETRKGKKPPIRKFIVLNQKYEQPKGLLEALRKPTPEEQEKIDKYFEKKAKEKAKQDAIEAKIAEKQRKKDEAEQKKMEAAEAKRIQLEEKLAKKAADEAAKIEAKAEAEAKKTAAKAEAEAK